MTHQDPDDYPMLNDLTRPRNDHHCDFRNRKDMAEHCHYVWMHFFWHLLPGEPRVDLAIWKIGDVVRVRPASTAIDESQENFKPPHPVYFEVKGYRQARRKIEKQKGASAQEIADEIAALDTELWDSMLRAIVEGLNYKNAQKSYSKYNTDEEPFAAIATKKDEGLHASDFQLVWKNEKGPTIPTIRRRAKTAKGRPLLASDRKPSARRQHLDKLKVEEKQEKEAAKKFWAREKEKAEARKPAARKKFARRIEQASAALPKSSGKPKKSGFPLSLEDGNQTERLVVPKLSLDKLVDIHVNYRWSNFDEYDNRVWEYSYALIDPAVKIARVKQLTTLWGKLNRPQKVFLTFLNFVGQIDNGGVWQFLFNSPELSLAALEMLEELGVSRLAKDYRKVLEELVGKAGTVAKLREGIADQNLTDSQRWEAFAEGYQELATAAQIQKYFYTAKFKKTLFKKMSDYVEESFHLLARIPDISPS